MIKCQSGAMAWMTRSVKMQTKSGGLGGMFKKAISGESLFLNNYIAELPGEIAFEMSFPGHILAVDISQMPLIAQKKAFLAGESTVNMEVFLQKKICAGFFGGEGLFNTILTGPGRVWLQTMPISALANSLAPLIVANK
ncbi:AIM24 family protein [Hornefia butyriciproducens]|uniref:AIM24 family protein n=1 Tax=Hornefia butyriciproducens TaxID=2652293 RepID=UPI003F8B2E39